MHTHGHTRIYKRNIYTAICINTYTQLQLCLCMYAYVIHVVYIHIQRGPIFVYSKFMYLNVPVLSEIVTHNMQNVLIKKSEN